MSISVTVSGDESTSVISSQLNTGSITVSGSQSIQVTSAGVNSASVTVSTGDPVTITGNFSNFVTGSVVRPNEISSFITSSNLSALETATGNLNTRVNSNDSDITSLNAATGALSTATGLLVPKSETGSFLTSGQIDTNIGTAVANLVDSAPSTLDTLNELASGLGNDPNFATTITSALGNKVNKSETGSFAVTGSDVTFSNLTVTGDILPENNVVSDIGSPSKRFKDLYLSGDSIFLGDSKISFSGGATGSLNITGSGITGRFLQDVETGAILLPFQTATGQLSSATGILNNVNESITGSTGILNSATGSLTGATGALSTATGTLNTNINTVSGLITSNDSDIANLNTATGVLTGATGALSTATGALSTNIGTLTGATGILSAATGALSTATGVLQGVTGSFAQTGSGVFNLLNVADHAKVEDINFKNGIIYFGNPTGSNQVIGVEEKILYAGTLDALIWGEDGVSIKLQGDNIKKKENDNTKLGFPNGTNDFAVTLDGSEKFRLLSGGNFGIGTASPQAKLHVSGTSLLSGDVTATANLKVTGNVGIGTTSPDTQLHIKSTGDVVMKLEADTDNTNENDNPLIQFTQDSGAVGAEVGFNGLTDGAFANALDNAFYIESNSSAGVAHQHIQFATNNKAQLSITDDKIGIGTNSPQAKLHVSGASLFSGNVATSGDLTVTGNVGIGVDPQFPLDIGGTTSSTGNTIRIAQNNGGTAIRIGAGGGSSDVVLMRIDGQSQDNAHDGITDSAAFGFSMKYMGSLAGNDNALRIISDNQQGTAVNALNILQDGSIGLNTISPQARLHVSGDTIVSGGNLQIGSTPAYSQTRSIKLHDNGVQFGARISLIGTNDDGGPGFEMVTDGNLSKRTLIRHEGEGSNDYGLSFFTTNGGTVSEKVRFDGNGNVGIGTGTPSAKLHVVGSGIITNDFAVDTNTLFVDASANNVGIRTSSPRNLYALHVDDNFLVTNGPEDHFNIDTNAYSYKLGDISGGDNGSFLEINSALGTASVSNAAFGIGVTLPQASLHVNGSAIVSGGLTTLGKTTLSSSAFVIETGSFTLGNTHKGATVLLQNSTSINITVPAQVSGYVTTFIAETHNSVSFVTGSGMSGLNSFQGASDMAGIYGQAQVIYKSAEYAFLGGNVV